MNNEMVQALFCAINVLRGTDVELSPHEKKNAADALEVEMKRLVAIRPPEPIPAPGEATCELCHQSMPEGEEMFKYHGYSGACPTIPSADSTGTP